MPAMVNPPRPFPSLIKSPSTYLGTAAIVAASFVVARGQDLLGAESSLAIAAFATGIVAISFVAAIFLRRREFRCVQQDRDRFAAELIGLLRKGEGSETPFSLYIRPFFTDAQLLADGRVRDPGQILMSPTLLAEIGHPRDAERAAAHALERYAPLVALGKQERRLGAGKVVTTDEEWQNDFRRLSALAKRILVIPVAQPSTMWELTQIAADPELLKKTVFVRPANRFRLNFGFKPESGRKTFSAIWNTSRKLAHEILPQLPPFRGGIRLLALDKSGQLRASYGDAMSSTHHSAGMRPLIVKGLWQRPSRFAYPFWATMAALLATDLIPGAVPTFEEEPELVWALGDSLLSLVQWGDWLWIPTILLACYAMTLDSIPTKAIRGLTAIMLVAAGLRVCDGLINYFIRQYYLSQISTGSMLLDRVLETLFFNDLVGRIAMAIGVAIFLRMVLGQRLLWPILGAAAVGFILEVLLQGPMLDLLIFLFGIRLADIGAALLVSGLTEGAMLAAVVAWIGSRSLKTLAFGFGLGWVLHIAGHVGGMAVGFGSMNLLVELDLLRARDFENVGLYLVTLIKMAVFLCFPFILRRFGVFPRPARWQSTLPRPSTPLRPNSVA